MTTQPPGHPATGPGHPAGRIWPGTDQVTGWPLEPQGACPKGEKQCHVRLLKEGGLDCAYQPEYCPFYGRYPDLSRN